MEMYKKAYEDKKLIGILMLMGAAEQIPFTFKVEGDINNGYCIGYAENGQEIARVPLKEPIIIRKEHDQERDVHRISIS